MIERIAFITGSVEAGRDGVGDYTRALALECGRQGVRVRVLALSDRHVAASRREQWAANVDSLRLPYAARWRPRIAEGRQYLREQAPSWVSLQFVPYSHQRWGVPLALRMSLRRLIGNARLHIMFHELWSSGTTSLRWRLTTAAQRRLVIDLACSADRVHTTNHWYREMFLEQGQQSDVLRLFGSFSPAAGDCRAATLRELEQRGCTGISVQRDRWWICAIFGTIHPAWPPQPLLTALIEAATSQSKMLGIVSIGRVGAGASVWQRIQECHGPVLRGVELGERSEAQIACLLQTADFGIATTPALLLGKSSAAATMFDHGLPLIVNDHAEQLAVADLDERRRSLTIPTDEHFGQRLVNAQRAAPHWSVTEIARQWLAALQETPAEAATVSVPRAADA